jgi:hypothetical protein
MKRILLLSLCLGASVLAQDLKPITSPDLKTPLPEEWSVRHGTWEVQDGVMKVAEVPENKHAAVLWHQVPLQTGAVDCEFMLDGAKTFILGCDGEKHIGRIVITPQAIRLLDDSTEVKGKSPSKLLSTAPLELKSGEWHKLHYEWNGDRMAATLDDVKVEATNPNLGLKKSRWWFAVGGASLKIRNIAVAGVKP